MRQEKKTGHGTRRAIASSVLAIVLCLVMLMGSTFAWFTDTASTGVNKIVSGNLDVGLEYWGVDQNGQEKWLTAEDSKKLFDENALWEPGYTQIIYLKVKNNGNLALNYAMQITPVHETVGVNVNGDEFKLSDYIKFGWTTFTADANGAPVSSLNRAAARSAAGEGVKLGESLHRQASDPLAAEAEELVALVAWMPENVGNVANYGTVQPTIELTLKVLATQAAVESDSFNNTYDAAAATEEGLDSKPEYDYESLYDYGNLEGYGVTVEKNGAGKVVKATVSGVNGKVPDGFFYNNRPGTEATPIDRWRDLEEVVIEEGVTEIGVDAFSVCTSLKKVTLPESLQKIGEKAFSYCTSLNEINIPDSVNVIGPKAFYFCQSLTSIHIPEGVTEIGDKAFCYAGSLNTVNFPTTLTKIGNSAFQDCGFTSVNVPATVKELGEGAFSGCESLTSATIAAKTVGTKTFYACPVLENVTFTDDVETIGENVFRECWSLKSVEIPASVTSIGEGAFTSCRVLEEVTFKGGTVKKGTFNNCQALKTLIISDNATLDASFTAGHSKNSLETVKIDRGEIGDSAFSNCKNLTTVELGDGVTSIGTSAFLKCTQLPSITTGSSVTSIGTSAFNGCTTLTKAEIKGGVIGENAFNGCTRLVNVTLGDGVTEIGKNAFFKCTALTSMKIGSSVTTIAQYAFSNCTALEEVTISAARVENQAFKGAKALKKVTLGDGVVNIPTGVFSGCGMGNKNNSPQLYLKAGTWTCDSKTITVVAGEPITYGNKVFNAIVSNRGDATWSASVTP